jgi:microcystin-dependent protein
MPIIRKSGVPVGTIVFKGHLETDAGYLPCDGVVHNIAAYPRLGAKWGATWGGDGVTTFGTPDMRGESVRGLDQGRGVDVGRVLGTAQAGQMPSHTHGVQLGTRDGGDTGRSAGSTSGITAVVVTEAEGGTSNASENRMRNLAFPFYVKT